MVPFPGFFKEQFIGLFTDGFQKTFENLWIHRYWNWKKIVQYYQEQEQT